MDNLVSVSKSVQKRHGQVVVGPPGSGKTTYCKVMSAYLRAHGRKTIVVNLDPGNEGGAPVGDNIDICQLISLFDTMDKLQLGPNGATIYCLEYLEKNIDWLQERLELHKEAYILFDLPGQVELWTHHTSLKNILGTLDEFKFVSVHLIDSFHVRDLSRYISVLMLALTSMLMLELPHINVLSKIDILEQYGELPYGFEIYANPAHLPRLLQFEGDTLPEHLRELTESISQLIQEFDLVYFEALDVADEESVARIAALADRACGYLHKQGEDLRGTVAKPYGYDAFERVKDKYNL